MTPTLSLVLRAQLPLFDPAESEAPERGWLFEVMAGSFLPMIALLDRLGADGVRAPLTLAVCPGLVVLLDDERVRQGVEQAQLGRIQEGERALGSLEAPLVASARARLEVDREALSTFRRCGRDVAGAWARLAGEGRLSLIPTASAGALLPLVASEGVQRAHARSSARAFRARFGVAVEGVWLPECGWSPGLDRALIEVGARYTVVSAGGASRASARPLLGTWAPLLTPSGLACFGRHEPPGGPLGWAPGERSSYLRLGPGEDPTATSWRVYGERGGRAGVASFLRTSNGAAAIHDPEQADAASREHGRRFLAGLSGAAAAVADQRSAGFAEVGRSPSALCAWPAECFGVAWAEGWGFMEALLRGGAEGELGVRLATPVEVLDGRRRCQVATPDTSSWDEGGAFGPWVEPSTGWLYRHTRRMEGELLALVEREDLAQDLRDVGGRSGPPRVSNGVGAKVRGKDGGGALDGLVRRAARLVLRELMLAQSADLAGMIALGPHADRGVERAKRHIGSAGELLGQIAQGRADRRLVEAIEARGPRLLGLELGDLRADAGR